VRQIFLDGRPAPDNNPQPWTVRVNQRLLVDTDLIEFVCQENEKFSSQFRN
jgi:hypothetical protein